jgi:hypothetical protein
MANPKHADGLNTCPECSVTYSGDACPNPYCGPDAPTDGDDEPKTKAARTRGGRPKHGSDNDTGWSFSRTPRTIFRSDLTPMARLAYCAMANARWSNAPFEISRPVLAKSMGVSEMTAWAALAELITAGWIIKVVQRHGGHGANAYRFTDTAFRTVAV